MVRQLARNGCVEESYRELVPMLERVLKHRGFFEWWTPRQPTEGIRQIQGLGRRADRGDPRVARVGEGSARTGQ